MYEAVCEWAKKVRVGGIVFGHDYKGHSKRPYVREVKYVIPSYCYAKGVTMVCSGKRHP